MSSNTIFEIKSQWSKDALINKKDYETLYEKSIQDNLNFWKQQGQRVDWIKPYTKIKDVK